MVKSELIKRSPLRILEKSIRGGVGAGNIGVLASPKGVGKTACLVHIATDKLFQEKRVIHVSFAARTDHIVSWYEDIFREIARKRDLDDAVSVHDQLIKQRVIMNFNQHGITVDQLIKSLTAMVSDGQFGADLIIIDGYDFNTGEVETLRVLRSFAKDHGIAIWASASLPQEDVEVDERGVPKPLRRFIDEIGVLITLTSEERAVRLNLVKDHDRYVGEDLHLRLDPRTLLIAED